MVYTIIRDANQAKNAGELGLALDIIKLQIVTNLAKVHQKLVNGSKIKEAEDVYDSFLFFDVSEEDKEKMKTFFELAQNYLELNSWAQEFDEPVDSILPEFEEIQEELKSLMESVED